MPFPVSSPIPLLVSLGSPPKYTACTQILISDYQPRRAIWFHPGAHRAEPKSTTPLRLLLKSGRIQAFPSPSLRGSSDRRLHRPSHSNPPGQDPRQAHTCPNPSREHSSAFGLPSASAPGPPAPRPARLPQTMPHAKDRRVNHSRQ